MTARASKAKTAFLVASIMAFLLMTAGYLIAIIWGWPSLFFHPERADIIELTFMQEGTALSPPLWAYLPFGVLIALTPKGGSIGALSGLGIIVFAGLFIAGGIWHSLQDGSEFVPQAAVLWGGVATAIYSGAVLLFGLASLPALLARK